MSKAADMKITPCIWLNDQAESAAAFYVRTFPEGRVIATSRYPESIDTPSGKPRGSVLTVDFAVGGQRFTALNGGPLFSLNPSISFFVHTNSVEAAESIYAALADGGKALMPLGAYPWSGRYGWVQDRFGVSWQVIAGQRPPGGAMIVPCLMFSGIQHGRATEAIRAYAGIFPDSRIEHIEHYSDKEGPPGTIKHGRFVLDGQEVIAMDSHVSHDVAFNESLSLQVMCADQDELDRFWNTLGEDGEHGPCGWLKDRFGLSWQVVPTVIAQWMSNGDSAARDRVFEAMLKMKKLDIAVLQLAFENS